MNGLHARVYIRGIRIHEKTADRLSSNGTIERRMRDGGQGKIKVPVFVRCRLKVAVEKIVQCAVPKITVVMRKTRRRVVDNVGV